MQGVCLLALAHPPILVEQASVSTMKVFVKSARAGTSAVDMVCFNARKAVSAYANHWKAFFFSKLVKGLLLMP